MERVTLILLVTLLVVGCDRDEKTLATLEQRVSAAESKIKALEAPPTPTGATENRSSSEQIPVITQTAAAAAPPTPLSTETLSGDGKQATKLITLQQGLYVFRFTHTGTRNFIVHLLDSDGRKVENLVNVIGSFSGSKAIRISTPGQYLLDIDADGPWSAVAGPP